MPFEKFDLESLDKERRKAIAKSIRIISVEELKKLGEEIFHYADDPWCETSSDSLPRMLAPHSIKRSRPNLLYKAEEFFTRWQLQPFRTNTYTRKIDCKICETCAAIHRLGEYGAQRSNRIVNH